MKTTLVLLLLLIGADLYGRSTPQYKLARAFLSSAALAGEAGEIKYYLNTAFRITGIPWQTSRFSFFVVGSKRRGWLVLEVVNRDTGASVDRVVFDDTPLPSPN